MSDHDFLFAGLIGCIVMFSMTTKYDVLTEFAGAFNNAVGGVVIVVNDFRDNRFSLRCHETPNGELRGAPQKE